MSKTSKKIVAAGISTVLVLCMGGMAVGCSSDSGSSDSKSDTAAEQEKITYKKVSVDDLVTALEKNAAKAEKTYQDEYVKLTGKISNFDSDGAYISLEGSDEWSFTSVTVNLSTDELKDKVLDFETGDTVVVTGQITDIGEILGYTIEAEKIKRK